MLGCIHVCKVPLYTHMTSRCRGCYGAVATHTYGTLADYKATYPFCCCATNTATRGNHIWNRTGQRLCLVPPVRSTRENVRCFYPFLPSVRPVRPFIYA